MIRLISAGLLLACSLAVSWVARRWLLARLWAEVGTLHRPGIAHRSLRAANVMVSPAGQPTIVDFGFSEVAATQRQQDLDVAELLASLAALTGEDRAAAAAAAGRAAAWAGRSSCRPAARCW